MDPLGNAKRRASARSPEACARYHYLHQGVEAPDLAIINYVAREDRSSRTTASCPLSAAYHNGVRPHLSFESGSTLPVSSRTFTTPSCPFPAACRSGVHPCLSFESGSTLPVSSSSFTTASWPDHAARDSGVSPF